MPLEVRIGINTGEVVLRMVHTGGHTEYTPVGHAANLAARMQTVGPAGGIVISEDTRHLVEGYFELRDLGPTEIKGEPINVYEVVGAGLLRGHFELAARRGLTKFVGRESELKQMVARARTGTRWSWADRCSGGRGRYGQIAAVLRVQGNPAGHCRHICAGRSIKTYVSYYNQVRIHLSLNKDAPIFRRAKAVDYIAAIPLLAELHHHYVWV